MAYAQGQLTRTHVWGACEREGWRELAFGVYVSCQNPLIRTIYGGSARLWHIESALYSTMRDVIARLPENFLRCHNSYLVNAGRVASINPTEVVLTSGAKVPMSKRYAKEVRKQLRASEE